MGLQGAGRPDNPVVLKEFRQWTRILIGGKVYEKGWIS